MATLTLNHLLDLIKKYHPDADLDLVKLTYEYSCQAHSGQKRKTGENYIIHPLGTACILAEMKVNIPVIIAALLHDVPEDTPVTMEEIEKEFGKDIAGMVAGVTKLGHVKYRGVERYIENLRKMFVAMAQDLRVIIIKFADRLNNLESLHSLPPDKQKRIAQETLEIYTPIANRLGMGELKGRMEDAAFAYLYPEAFQKINTLISRQQKIQEKYIQKIKRIANHELSKNNIHAVSIHGRAKRLYSLFRKLEEKGGDISKVYDLIAVRIIVETIGDCYATLGLLHNIWRPIKGRIKDYIAQPKPNGYRSLHTTVFCEDNEIVEFQIRTQRIHEEAEYGVAAYWHYDEKGSLRPDPRLKWVSELTKWRRELDQNIKHLEEMKIDILQTRIFVFTPQGDVIDLPDGATPIDFAYHIHTDVGNKCAGALINDQIANLNTSLKNGDVIEIILDKNRKTPNPDWLKLAKTNVAKNKIRNSLKTKRNHTTTSLLNKFKLSN